MKVPEGKEAQIKELFKQAIRELLQERGEEFYELFLDVLEDVAMTRAIQDGEPSEPVSKTEVYEALKK